MHWTQVLVYLPTIASCILLALLVFVNDPKDRINRRFTYFIATVTMWLFCLFLADTASDPSIALVFIRLALVFASLMPYLFLLFSSIFPDNRNGLNKPLSLVAFLPPLFFMVTAFSPLMISGVKPSPIGAQVTESSIIYTLQSVYLVLYFLLGFILLIHKRKKLVPKQKSQINFIVLGVATTAIINIITNIILVVATGDSSYGVLIGIPSLVIMVGAMAYSIIKHGLFDIRLVIARSLGYVLSVGTLVVVYGLVAFSLVNELAFEDSHVDTVQRVVFTVLAVGIAFTFQPLKKFFDRQTNKVFYRDAYDVQELLDKLSTVLISTIDINKLLAGVAQLVSTTLKSEFCTFTINGRHGLEQRLIGAVAEKIDATDLTAIKHAMGGQKGLKSVIVDDLQAVDRKLYTTLLENDISIVVHLTDSPGSHEEEIGFMALGTKKSGRPYSSQDVKILEIIADELVIAVQNAMRFEEIQQFNITLQERVDDATHKLRKTNEKLKKLDETKDDFISMASHQLRTPLTSIKGYVSMVMEGDAGKVSAKQAKLLDQAFISSQRMVYLIADLLNVSRLKTGKFVIEPKPTNLAEVISGEIDQLRETAKGRGLKLEYTAPKNFPVLNLDETKIRQVIMNFADNAIYYTPSGGSITVNLVDKPDSVEVTVVDNGIGVAKADQHHLFTKFYRANNAKKARPDGTGLGLFMAQKVIAAQGGAIIFSSEENRGSTFGFSFPKAKLLAKQPAQSPAQEPAQPPAA